MLAKESATQLPLQKICEGRKETSKIAFHDNQSIDFACSKGAWKRNYILRQEIVAGDSQYFINFNFICISYFNSMQYYLFSGVSCLRFSWGYLSFAGTVASYLLIFRDN